MLGRTHQLHGALAGAGTAAAVGLGPVATAAAMYVGSRAALLPDLDHPSSTACRSLGVLGRPFGRLVARVSGGHRNGTHTLAFAVLAGVVAAFAATALTGFLATALAALAARLPDGVRLPAVVEGVASPDAWWWVGPVVAAGAVAHLLGDAATPERVPLLAPLTRQRFGVPLIARTGGAAELKVVQPLSALAVVWAAWLVLGEPLLELARTAAAA